MNTSLSVNEYGKVNENENDNGNENVNVLMNLLEILFGPPRTGGRLESKMYEPAGQ